MGSEWIILSFVGALSNAGYFFLIKKVINKTNAYLIAGITNLSAGSILFALSINETQNISQEFLLFSSISILLGIITTILYYKALKISDLSVTIPMLSFTPLFLIITSSIILHEQITVISSIGILFIVIGSYILNIQEPSNGFFAPLNNFFKDKGIQYMLLVAFLFSIAVNTDKLIVINSNPTVSGGFVLSILGIFFLSIYYFFERNEPTRISTTTGAFILLASLLLSIEGLTINIAYTLSSVPLVISIKRLSIIISVLLGILILKEKHRVPRIIGSIIMITGAGIIILYN